MSAGEPQIECLSMNREGALTSHGSDPMPAGGGSTCSQVLDALKGLCFCYNLYIYIYQKSRGCIAINHINRDSRRLIRGKKIYIIAHLEGKCVLIQRARRACVGGDVGRQATSSARFSTPHDTGESTVQQFGDGN